MPSPATPTDQPLLTRLTAGIDDELAAAVDRAGLSRKLDEPLRYALVGGGKRLRPALVVASAEAAGAEAPAALQPAVAVEMIHAFSLVHDDLPAMDDDDLRRGRPTVHVTFGEAAAILAGDALMSLAFDEILRAPRGAELARELARATTAMIAGQTDDTLGAEAGVERLALLRRIHTNKTGALLRACCRMGAISADADAEALAALTRFGESIGLAYQIVDDLLDVVQTPEIAGKRTGKDESRGKLTYPGVIGVEGSRAEVARLEGEALEALSGFGESAEPLRVLCRSMNRRDR